MIKICWEYLLEEIILSVRRRGNFNLSRNRTKKLDVWFTISLEKLGLGEAVIVVSGKMHSKFTPKKVHL